MSKSKFFDEWGHFTQMPEIVIEMMPDLGSDAVTMFMYFRYRTNRERGCAFPTYKRMSEDIGWGRTRIKNAIDTLIDHGLCKKVKRFQKSAEYYLTKPADIGELTKVPPSIPVAGILQNSHSGNDNIPVAGTPVFPPTEQDLDSVNLDSVNPDSVKSDGKKKHERKRDPLFDAIADVCQVDPATCGSRIGKVKATLIKVDPPYTAEEVRAFGAWWWSDDFRRKRNTPPTVWQLQERIGVVRAQGNSRKSAQQVDAEIEEKRRSARERIARAKAKGKGR